MIGSSKIGFSARIHNADAFSNPRAPRGHFDGSALLGGSLRTNRNCNAQHRSAELNNARFMFDLLRFFSEWWNAEKWPCLESKRSADRGQLCLKIPTRARRRDARSWQSRHQRAVCYLDHCLGQFVSALLWETHAKFSKSQLWIPIHARISERAKRATRDALLWETHAKFSKSQGLCRKNVPRPDFCIRAHPQWNCPKPEENRRAES